MNLEVFASLPTTQIAQLVREAGSRVCVFPLKGTRRWFILEYPTVRRHDSGPSYLQAVAERSLELYEMIFDYGLNTLLTPSFSPAIMARGKEYMQMAAEGLARLATHPDFLDFYQAYGVRVRFYGDYRRFFDATPYAYLSNLFDELTARTITHEQRRLFFGLFAHDPIETVANLAVQHYVVHGQAPDKETLVARYYGEYVEPVDLFIGFGKFRAFDMPLVTTGREDLYFTVNPSLYFTETQFRGILYDHLYARKGPKVHLQPEQVREMLYDHSGDPTGVTGILEPDTLVFLRDFYQANMGKTLGVGRTDEHSGYWYPLPQVKLPATHANCVGTG